MRAPSVWDLLRLVFCAAAFGWRIERFSNGDAVSGLVAAVFGVAALMLAYRVWALGHLERIES